MKKALILGGGVAGCSVAHYLSEKNVEATIINAQEKFGGLARTEYYAGHPYEFGPHIWFWPGGEDSPINKTIVELTDGELFYIDRKLFSYIESDQSIYRYPIHFDDISKMPESKSILSELSFSRDAEFKLIPEKLPTIGMAKFAEYFKAAIGSTLYEKFMKNYTQKMWNISGDDLETSMVWADRFNNEYSKEAHEQKWIYDPLKFENHTLGKGITFQIYPKKGWNDVWDKMIRRAEKVVDRVTEISIQGSDAVISSEAGRVWNTSDFDYVINTLDLDTFFGDKDLPYTGRMIIPLLLPALGRAFPDATESIHYSSAEFMTRVTEMKQITQHESKDTLLLIEIPIVPGSSNSFPKNVIENAIEKNLYAEKAYPQQSKAAIKYHQELVAKSKQIKNWYNVGRHAQFKYWGMPETVNSAFTFVQNLDLS